METPNNNQAAVPNGAVDMESQAGGVPNVSGREVPNPDNSPNDNVLPVSQTADKVAIPESKQLPGMEEKLQYVPDELKERVAKLTRDDIAMPGINDKEAYVAYLNAEKMVRDKRRQGEKHRQDFSTIPSRDE